MRSSRYQQTMRRFIFILATVLAALAGMFAWDSVHEYQGVVSEGEKHSASYASALKEHAERVFSEADNTLQGLIEEIEANGDQPYSQGDRFRRRLNKLQKGSLQFNSIYIVDQKGDVVAHSQGLTIKPINLADSDYFLHHRGNQSAGLYISKPFICRETGRRVFSISRPLKDRNGQFSGLVSILFETGYFETFYNSIDLGSNGRTILATTGGELLIMAPAYEKPFAQNFKESIVFTTYLPNSAKGCYQLVSSVSNDVRIISYKKLANYPVVAIVSLDKQELIGHWQVSLYKKGSVALLLLFFILLFSFLFLRQVRSLEMTSFRLEQHQSELAAKNDTIMTAIREWRGTFDALEDAVCILDMERRVISANTAAQEIFGRSPQEILGQHCCQITYGKIIHRKDCPFEEMLKRGGRASAQFFKDNRWYEASVDPIIAENAEIVKAVYIVKDITDLKRAEQREHVRSEVLELIARGEPLAPLLAFIVAAIENELPQTICSIMLVDKDGRRLENTVGPSLPDFYKRAINRTKIGEGIGSCGTAAYRKERVVVEDVDTHPFWKGFTPVQEAGLRSCWSEPIISSAGQLLGTFAVYHRRPAVPGDDEIRMIEQAAAFSAIALERSRNEEERAELEAQLGQSQKMEAIGQLAGGVAHDFNNLLTPIIVYADLLKRSLHNDEKLLPKIDGIVKASHKARDLTQQLLSFGRKQVMQMKVVDLNEVVSAFYSIMRRTLREDIDIKMQLSTYPGIICADRAKIDQIILNLAINAQDAIAENGQVTLETGQIFIDDEYARLHPGMQTGRYILLAFKDDGCGISNEDLRHIFEPFFTTKEVGRGTGLGLANVYGIVKQHKGYIAVQSKVGVGTTFSIYFPMVDEAPDTIVLEEGGSELGLRGGTETILLVEDNEMVRNMVSDLLGGLGYRMFVAEHPEQALEMLRQNRERIDLLITDVVMPGMNGQQLFEQISVDRPDISRVLYISGYTNNVIVTSGVMEGSVHFLPKPFTVDALIEKVSGLLPSKVRTVTE